MATKQEVISDIQTWIIQNSNNEITADIMRPILLDMVNQINDLTGALATLNTTDKSTLVAAINEVNNSSAEQFTVHTGTGDPNTTPPATFELGDFYNRTSGGSTIDYYIYNGTKWVALVGSSKKFLGGINVRSTSYTVTEGTYTIIFTGSTAGQVITLPTPLNGSQRLLRICNFSTVSLGLSQTVITATGSLTAIPTGESWLIQSDGTNWYKVN